MFRYLLLLVLFLFTSISHAEIKADHRHTLFTLITSENPQDWQIAEEIVRLQRYGDREALDAMAERLYQSVVLQNSDRYFVPLARYARALGESGQVRYRTVLQQCQSRYTNPKMLKYITPALQSLPALDDAPYVPGQVDLEALAIEARMIWEVDQQKRVGQQRVIPRLGRSMDQVYAELGLPDYVNSLEIEYTRLGNIKAFYYGLGIVQFDYVDKYATELTVSEVMPEASPAAVQYQGPNKPLAHALISAHDKYMRYLIKGAKARFASDPALSEVLYTKLLLMAQTENKYGEAAIVDALKILNKLNTPGFDQLLQQLVVQGKDFESGDAAEALLKHRRKEGISSRAVNVMVNEPEQEHTEAVEI